VVTRWKNQFPRTLVIWTTTSKVSQPTPQVLLLAVRVERGLGARKRAATYAEMLRESYPDSPQAIRL